MASSEPPKLFTLARNKLHSSVGSKESCSLHRWVLLKNSIIRSTPSSPTPTAVSSPDTDDDVEDVVEEEDEVEETDSFMFPDAGQLVIDQPSDTCTSEAQWLDSLLEKLGDDDEDDLDMDTDMRLSTNTAEDEEEDLLLSPLLSPLSSSDDLPSQTSYFPTSVPVPYPVSYPLLHPPLIHAYELNSDISIPYENPFPYHDINDMEDSSLPDAVEDTSDDESETPPTPSIGRSATSLTLVDPASIPLPAERTRRRQPHPRVYIDNQDSYFYPFELDPLPFPEDHHISFNPHQEC